jgi:acyl-CoA thioester hydrolase
MPPARPSLRPAALELDVGLYDIPHPSPRVFEIEIDRSQLSDVVPHVNNVEYVRWLDRAAELHSDSVGWTRDALFESGMMWFVARHEVDYVAEAWGHDSLFIATWVRNFHKVKTWRDHVVFRPSDRQVICRASTLWVLVDLATGRPRRIGSDMVELFQPLEAITSPSRA